MTNKMMVKTYVNDELYNQIMQKANEKHISISMYISELLIDDIRKNNNKELLKENNNTKIPSKKKLDGLSDDLKNIDNKINNVLVSSKANNDLRLVLDKDTAFILSQKAAEQNLTATAYVRNLIHTKDFKIYNIETNDIDDFIGEVHKAVNALSSTISLIKRQGKGQIFQQDITYINSMSQKLVDLLNQICENLYTTRKKVQSKLTKQYKKEK